MFEPAWSRLLLRAEKQSLEDVARTQSAEVAFVRASTAAMGTAWLDLAEDQALSAGFVTSRVSVFRDRAFDEFDALVRAVGRAMRVHGSNEKGLPSLLLGAADHRAVRDAVRRGPVGSDVFALANDFFAAKDSSVRQVNRIEAWLSGVEGRDEQVKLRSLSKRSAKRALGDLTQLVLALGYRGMVVLFEGAEVVTKLPIARREYAYVVLRELIDNADGGRGLVSLRILVSGADAFFEGKKSLMTLAPLAMRVRDVSQPSLVPHASIIHLKSPHDFQDRKLPSLRKANEGMTGALSAVMRASHGLPTTIHDEVKLTVATERIEAHVDSLFSLSAIEGSVFVPVRGAYGSGKTHLLLYLAARAMRERRPVFRLSLERLDADLGSPQRHLYRLLDQSMLPVTNHPSALDVLSTWTENDSACEGLLAIVKEIAKVEGEAAQAAKRLLRAAETKDDPAPVLRTFLSGSDLADRPSSMSYRRDAYGRFLLWLALLGATIRCGGPVLLIDEAENLYRSGMRESERRTALRSLSFYCGGALPGTCVVLAITPEALVSLRRDAGTLLKEVSDQATALAWEDASMFRLRLKRAPVLDVPPLDRRELAMLATKLRRVHEIARGVPAPPNFRAKVEQTMASGMGPRAAVREWMHHLESSWWMDSE